MKTIELLPPYRCTACGEAIFDRKQLEPGEFGIVFCDCGNSTLISGAPRLEFRQDQETPVSDGFFRLDTQPI